MNYEVVQKVKDFVKKFNNGELVIDTSKFGNWATSDYGVNPMYNELAKAIHDYEIADSKHWDYSLKIDEVNKMINLAISHGIITDTSRTKQTELLNEKILKIENELNISKNVIDKLREEKSDLKAKIDLYETRYPALKKSLESDGEEGEVIE